MGSTSNLPELKMTPLGVQACTVQHFQQSLTWRTGLGPIHIGSSYFEGTRGGISSLQKIPETFALKMHMYMNMNMVMLNGLTWRAGLGPIHVVGHHEARGAGAGVVADGGAVLAAAAASTRVDGAAGVGAWEQRQGMWGVNGIIKVL